MSLLQTRSLFKKIFIQCLLSVITVSKNGSLDKISKVVFFKHLVTVVDEN